VIITSPVGVTLSTDREVSAVVSIVVAGVVGREQSTDVVARRAAEF